MKRETKLVTSTPDVDCKDKKQPLDTNRPVALSGLTRQHLENQGGGGTKGGTGKGKKSQC